MPLSYYIYTNPSPFCPPTPNALHCFTVLTVALPRPTPSIVKKVFTQSTAGGGKPLGDRLQTDPCAHLPFDDMNCSAAVESHLKNIAWRCGYKEPSERPKMAEVRSSRGEAHFMLNVCGGSSVSGGRMVDHATLSERRFSAGYISCGVVSPA